MQNKQTFRTLIPLFDTSKKSLILQITCRKFPLNPISLKNHAETNKRAFINRGEKGKSETTVRPLFNRTCLESDNSQSF